MHIFFEILRVLWLICLWFAFIFVALASLAMTVIGVWPWGAMFFLVGFIGLSAIDTVLKGGIGYESNGGLFHHFFIFVHSISAVGLIVLTVLTAFGVLRTADAMLWTPETNFASWYMVGGLFITYFLIQPTEPNDDIPDLQRMEQMDRRSTRVGVISAAIFTVLCLVVPLTSFMTAGYDPALWRLRFSWPRGSCVLCVRASSTCRAPALRRGLRGTVPCVPRVLAWLAWRGVSRSGMWVIRWSARSGCPRCSLLPRWR